MPADRCLGAVRAHGTQGGVAVALMLRLPHGEEGRWEADHATNAMASPSNGTWRRRKQDSGQGADQELSGRCNSAHLAYRRRNRQSDHAPLRLPVNLPVPLQLMWANGSAPLPRTADLSAKHAGRSDSSPMFNHLQQGARIRVCCDEICCSSRRPCGATLADSRVKQHRTYKSTHLLLREITSIPTEAASCILLAQRLVRCFMAAC